MDTDKKAVGRAKSNAGQKRPDSPSVDEIKLRLEQRRRRVDSQNDKIPPPPKSVAAGPAGVITDALINPTPEKMLEFTDFDRNQVSIIPTLTVLDNMWNYCQEVALFRQDPDAYRKDYDCIQPIMPNSIKDFIFVLAQCRRSLGGKTQKALEDLALADLDRRTEEGGEYGSRDGFIG